MEINLEREAALLETILFLESEPMEVTALMRASGLGKEVVEAALERVKEIYATPSHGVELIRMGEGYALAPKRENWNLLKEKYGRKNDQKLSRAALETLSIIAYSQPVTRAEIEGIRGVAVDTMVRFLLDKDLVKETGKKDAPGKPVQYGTTKEFLKFFRITSIADLPKLDDLERERFELEGED